MRRLQKQKQNYKTREEQEYVYEKEDEPSNLNFDVVDEETPQDEEPDTDFGDEPIDDNYLDDDLDIQPTPMQKYGDLLKELTNFSPFLRGCMFNWIGLFWNEEKQQFEQMQGIKPIMSYQGAVWCASFLRTYTRNNNIITDISHYEYIEMMKNHIDTVFLNIGTRDEFEIEEEGDLLRVADEMLNAARLILMGAGDGKYNDFMQTVVQRHENVNQIPQYAPYPQIPQVQQKRGFFKNIGQKLGITA
jgi:hypothetical protein